MNYEFQELISKINISKDCNKDMLDSLRENIAFPFSGKVIVK